jgi:FkbM family methyltransferase
MLLVPDGVRTLRHDVRTYGLKWWSGWVFRHQVVVPLLKAYLRPGRSAGLVRLGSELGGWWLPEFIIRPGALAYCVGAGEDISFDLALHDRGMRVVTVDPTPRAQDYVKATAPESDRFSFVPVGLWDTAEELRFYYPRDPALAACSVLNLQGSSDYFVAEVDTLRKLMDDFGDDHIDVLKVDIEGAEHRVIGSFVADGIRPTVLCVEFDQPVPIRTVLQSIRLLQQSGYRLLHIEDWNYTFVFANSHGPIED